MTRSKSYRMASPSAQKREAAKARENARVAVLEAASEAYDAARETGCTRPPNEPKVTFRSLATTFSVSKSALQRYYEERQSSQGPQRPKEAVRVLCEVCASSFAAYFTDGMEGSAPMDLTYSRKLLTVCRNVCRAVHAPHLAPRTTLVHERTLENVLSSLVETGSLAPLTLSSKSGKTFVRARAETEEEGRRFLDDLKEVMDSYALTREQVFILDETGIAVGVQQLVEAFCTSGESGVGVCQYTRPPSFHVTATVTQSAAGVTLPTQFLVKGPEGTVPEIDPPDDDRMQARGMCTKSAYQTHDSFWTFLNETLAPAIQKAVPKGTMALLLLDNAASHILTTSQYDTLIEYNIIVKYLVPNTTALFCPLDVAIFGPLKAKLRSRLSYDASITASSLPKIFLEMLYSVSTRDNVVSSFEKAMIIDASRAGSRVRPAHNMLSRAFSAKTQRDMAAVTAYLGRNDEPAEASDLLEPSVEEMLKVEVAKLQSEMHQAWLQRVTRRNRGVMKMDRAKLLQIGSIDKANLRTIKSMFDTVRTLEAAQKEAKAAAGAQRKSEKERMRKVRAKEAREKTAAAKRKAVEAERAKRRKAEKDMQSMKKQLTRLEAEKKQWTAVTSASPARRNGRRSSALETGQAPKLPIRKRASSKKKVNKAKRVARRLHSTPRAQEQSKFLRSVPAAGARRQRTVIDFAAMNNGIDLEE